MRDTALSEAIDTLPAFDRERTRLLFHEPQWSTTMRFSCRPPCAAREGVARTHARLTPSTVARSDVLSSASQLDGRLLPAPQLRLRQPERWRRSAQHCPYPDSTACICGRNRNDTVRCAQAARWSSQSSRTVYISRAPIRRRATGHRNERCRGYAFGVPSIDRLLSGVE
jgi:hypothetical protein